MNIAVCIKQVPVSNDVSVDPVTHSLIRESAQGMVNPADLNAIEEALVLKEQTGGRVVVFTMGPPVAEQSLRMALAMGCDEACLITDRCFGGGDTIATAKVLAAAISRYDKFDLILAGALSSDGATGQVGPMIAEYLSWPHISDVQQMQYAPEAADRIEAVKKYQEMDIRVAAKMPALVTVNFGCNTPRLTTLRSQRGAKSKPLATYTNAELQMTPEQVGQSGSPTAVVDSFEPEKTGKAALLSGDAQELSKQILALLDKEKGAS